MNRVTLLLFFLLFLSCDYFEKKKIYSEDLLEEELKTFNWNEVDTYPTFSNCDSITVKKDSKKCFENTLLASVNSYLERQDIVVSNDVHDTIKLHIEINKKGDLDIISMDYNPKTAEEIPEIDSLMRQSLQGVPKIFPAIKRGQQVTTTFYLPVIVKIK